MNGAAARNTGWHHSSGEYLLFLDNDDLLTSSHVERNIEAIQERSKAGCVLCDVLICKKGYPRTIYKTPTSQDAKKRILVSQYIGTGSNLFVRRQAVEDVGGFDERFVRNQDIEFLVRVLNYYECICERRLSVVKGTNATNNWPSAPVLYKTRLQFYRKFFTEISDLTIAEKQALIEGDIKTIIATDSDVGHKLAINLANAFGELFDVAITEIQTDFSRAVEHPAIQRVKGSTLVRRLYSRILLENVKRVYGTETYTELVEALHWHSDC